MADPEQLETLMRGVRAWNEWRQHNPEIDPDLSGTDLCEAELSEADLSRANLREVRLSGANLVRADLHRADLRNANLAGARMAGADLYRARLSGAQLMEADLSGARLLKTELREAHLSKADLSDASLFKADLSEARLPSANLSSANLRAANLRRARLAGADLRGADLSAADLEGAEVRGVRFDRRGRYRSVRVATCYGSQRFKRFAQDQDFLEEFRESKWRYPVYLVWLILADCGRSLALWAAWCLVFVFGFAVVFQVLGEEAFILDNLPWRFSSLLYCSTVLFTAAGDITPTTTAAARWVMAEVITGYIMLGGLISILAMKLARRS